MLKARYFATPPTLADKAQLGELMVDENGNLKVAGTFSADPGGATLAEQQLQTAELIDLNANVAGAVPTGTNSIGGTKDNGPHWTSVCGVAGEAVLSADATTATAVTDAPTAGQKLVIDDLIISVGAAMAVTIHEETSVDLMFPTIYMAANSTVQLTLRGKRKLLVADKKLMVDASAAGAISVLTTYHSEA